MTVELRDYQLACVDRTVDWFSTAVRGSRRVVAGPTGIGKSVVELGVQDRLGDGCWIVTPRLEIALGILRKKGQSPETLAELVEASFVHRVVTPVRFRNALLRGDVESVDQLLLDEGHHVLASTWDEFQLLCGAPPCCLFTATPFRGTSRGTAQFLSEWGQPEWMITFRDAVKRGDVALPKVSILPLVDDDLVELGSNGEFLAIQLTSAYSSRVEDLADAAVSWFVDSKWDRTTVFSVPGVDVAKQLAGALCRRNAPATFVTADTPRSERDACYELLLARHAALVQVSVLGEGVDLSIRRLVDAKPMMSPVAWMQQLGRATRPIPSGESPPEYVCTNRNLARHAYLLDGLLPPSVVAVTDQAFGKVSTRSSYRALGLEAIGRFKPSDVKLLDGCTAQFYNLVSADDGRMREYACLVHPAVPDAVWAERVHTAKPDGTRDWGKWQKCPAPFGVQGFGSVPLRDPSEKQMAWWLKSAEGRGLDPAVKVTRKNFGVLPFMFDLGLSFRSR